MELASIAIAIALCLPASPLARRVRFCERSKQTNNNNNKNTRPQAHNPLMP